MANVDWQRAVRPAAPHPDLTHRPGWFQHLTGRVFLHEPILADTQAQALNARIERMVGEDWIETMTHGPTRGCLVAPANQETEIMSQPPGSSVHDPLARETTLMFKRKWVRPALSGECIAAQHPHSLAAAVISKHQLQAYTALMSMQAQLNSRTTAEKLLGVEDPEEPKTKWVSISDLKMGSGS